MSSAFISYSTKDEALAQQLHSAISSYGIETFLASISINAGSNWTDVIFEKLEEATWIFFLATQNSINSPAVQQELGASLIQKKVIIPILIDITPEDLPGWVGNHQAIDYKSNPNLLHETISKVSKEVESDKLWTGIIFGVLITTLIAIFTKSDKN